MRRRTACLLTLLLPLAPAAAQPVDRPFVVPQRDVDVAYQMPLPVPAHPGAAQAAITQRMRFSVAGARQRVDPPGNGTYMISDYAGGRLLVVEPVQRVATALPIPGGPIAAHGVRATGAYRRVGPQTIAGVPCTDWATRDDAGNESVVCLTGDGVLLRAMQAGHVLLQATQVSYALQPAALFLVPDGYRTQAPPAPAPAPP